MEFEREDILKLATLSKMQLTDAEVNKLYSEVSSIISFAQVLDEVDVTNVEPLYQVNGSIHRSDQDVASISPDVADILQAFPQITPDGYLAVHAVFTDESPSH